MLSAFTQRIASLPPVQGTVSPPKGPGPVTVVLQGGNAADAAQIQFAAQSAHWVRTRSANTSGVHEPGLIRTLYTLSELAGDNSVGAFYDIGALHGYVSLAAAAILRPSALFSFEMNPGPASVMAQNFRLNQALGCDLNVVNAGVTDTSASRKRCYVNGFSLRVEPSLWQTLRLVRAGYRKHRLDLVSLDDFTAKAGVDPAVIKIDIEGSQMSVLRGARNLLDRAAPVLLIESDGPNATNTEGVSMSEMCRYLVSEHGYGIAAFDHRAANAPVTTIDADTRDWDGLGLERNRLLVCLPAASDVWTEPA